MAERPGTASPVPAEGLKRQVLGLEMWAWWIIFAAVVVCGAVAVVGRLAGWDLGESETTPADGGTTVTYVDGLDEWGFTPDEGRFFDSLMEQELATFPDIGTAPDTSVISDEEYVAGAHAFCEALGELETATPDDFSEIAEGQIAARFSEANRDGYGEPKANGPTLVAYTVGIAAVEALCPDQTAALG